MANIRDFIEKIGIARYGNDVRSSIMNALMAVNDESEKSVLLVNQSVEKANEASNVALEASNTANDLTSRAEIVIVEAEQSASDAEQSSIQAGEKAELAERNAKISQSYAVGGTGTRENEDIDNAMYYYMQAKHISQGNNGLVPMGTITFEELPISDITQNAMYNISNAFTSDERFLDGGGLNYGAGSNVYYTVNGKWDVLAASSVNGVKGNKESEYRQGNVNITPENIGALPEDGNAVSATKATQDSNGNNIVETYRTKTGDTADNVVSFASGDSVNPTGWEDINVVESGETHGSLFRKISLAIKNLRYLYNMIGTADIAAIGDGTIKGAITGLNNNLDEVKRDLPFKEFQTGTVKTNSVAGDTWSSTNVTFETEFSEVPKVLATMFDTSSNTGHCYIKSISKTGFTVRTMGTGYSTAHAHTVNWMAFV